MPDLSQLATLKHLIAPAAVEYERKSGIPAEFTAGQCILESGWLTKMSGDNNCFGIKWTKHDAPNARKMVATTEWFTDRAYRDFINLGDGRTASLVVRYGEDGKPLEKQTDSLGRKRYKVYDWFVSFPSLAACFERHAQLLLSDRYAPALSQYRYNKDIFQYIHGVVKAGYATDPSYEMSMLETCTETAVVDAVKAARLANVIAVANAGVGAGVSVNTVPKE